MESPPPPYLLREAACFCLSPEDLLSGSRRFQYKVQVPALCIHPAPLGLSILQGTDRRRVSDFNTTDSQDDGFFSRHCALVQGIHPVLPRILGRELRLRHRLGHAGAGPVRPRSGVAGGPGPGTGTDRGKEQPRLADADVPAPHQFSQERQSNSKPRCKPNCFWKLPRHKHKYMHNAHQQQPPLVQVGLVSGLPHRPFVSRPMRLIPPLQPLRSSRKSHFLTWVCQTRHSTFQNVLNGNTQPYGGPAGPARRQLSDRRCNRHSRRCVRPRRAPARPDPRLGGVAAQPAPGRQVTYGAHGEAHGRRAQQDETSGDEEGPDSRCFWYAGAQN